jgi:hypothetical protein
MVAAATAAILRLILIIRWVAQHLPRCQVAVCKPIGALASPSIYPGDGRLGGSRRASRRRWLRCPFAPPALRSSSRARVSPRLLKGGRSRLTKGTSSSEEHPAALREPTCARGEEFPRKRIGVRLEEQADGRLSPRALARIERLAPTAPARCRQPPPIGTVVKRARRRRAPGHRARWRPRVRGRASGVALESRAAHHGHALERWRARYGACVLARDVHARAGAAEGCTGGEEGPRPILRARAARPASVRALRGDLHAGVHASAASTGVTRATSMG